MKVETKTETSRAVKILVFDFAKIRLICGDMNFSIEHIAIPAADPVALKNWYLRVLGARVIFDNGQNPPTLLIALPGGGWFEIYAAEKNLPERDYNKLQGFRHVALRVDSLDAAKTELENQGVRFTEEIRPAAGGGKVLFFADGEGNLLHLVERPTKFLPDK
ncbi:MAG TPA: VOC family protein [Verrucomicrobiae bacterium]|nr:VOC family protein [Verrucomicrobiae bacterium]